MCTKRYLHVWVKEILIELSLEDHLRILELIS